MPFFLFVFLRSVSDSAFLLFPIPFFCCSFAIELNMIDFSFLGCHSCKIMLISPFNVSLYGTFLNLRLFTQVLVSYIEVLA